MQKVNTILSKSEMLKDLRPLLNLAPQSSVLPILSDVLIMQNGKLRFFTTDLENQILVDFPSPTTDEFITGLSARSLKHFISNSLDKEIILKGDQNKLTLESGGFVLNHLASNPDQFPKAVELNWNDIVTFKMDVKTLRTNLTNALKFVSDDDLRPAMTGVHFKSKNGFLEIAATDAHKLYWKSVSILPKGIDTLKMTLPTKGVKLFLEMFEKGDVTISYDWTYVNFTQGNKSLTCKCIDATYPDYEKVVPSYDFAFYMQRKQLQSFLRLASEYVSKSTKQINLLVDRKGITIESREVDFSVEFQYKVPIYNATSDFEEFTFAINMKFFQDIISYTKDEYIKINHSKQSHKAIIIDDCALLMPLILNV